MAELADAADSKSAGVYPRAGSTPALGTKHSNSFAAFKGRYPANFLRNFEGGRLIEVRGLEENCH